MVDQLPEKPYSQIIIYQIDESDLITYVSDNWNQFAQDNNAAENTFQPCVLNKPIWNFIVDLETRHLYKILVNKVRSTGTIIRVPFRCDSPGSRRFMIMTINPLSGNNIELLSHVLRIEFRDSVQILDKNSTRSNAMITMCSFCKKIAVAKNKWEEAEEAIRILHLFDSASMPQITHGLCPDCYQTILDELD